MTRVTGTVRSGSGVGTDHPTLLYFKNLTTKSLAFRIIKILGSNNSTVRYLSVKSAIPENAEALRGPFKKLAFSSTKQLI
jgi:hypothetical protein